MEAITNSQPAQKVGDWKGGWLLARSCWTTLKLDKELVAYPLYSALYSMIWAGLIGGVMFGAYLLTGHTASEFFGSENFPLPHWAGYVASFLTLLGMYLVNNYYMAALVASALHRFEGGDPTVAYGLQRAKLRSKALIKFSFVQASLGTFLQAAEEKLPFAGKLLAWIVDIGWHLASFFAIPVIVMSDRDLGPIEAVRESAGVFKKTWSKNFTGGLALGGVFMVALFSWLLFAGASAILALSVGIGTLFITVPIAVLLLVALMAVTGALNGIFVSALYHYAKTEQSPLEFDHNLLLAAFKPKKKWFA